MWFKRKPKFMVLEWLTLEERQEWVGMEVAGIFDVWPANEARFDALEKLALARYQNS